MGPPAWNGMKADNFYTTYGLRFLRSLPGLRLLRWATHVLLACRCTWVQSCTRHCTTCTWEFLFTTCTVTTTIPGFCLQDRSMEFSQTCACSTCLLRSTSVPTYHRSVVHLFLCHAGGTCLQSLCTTASYRYLPDYRHHLPAGADLPASRRIFISCGYLLGACGLDATPARDTTCHHRRYKQITCRLANTFTCI